MSKWNNDVEIYKLFGVKEATWDAFFFIKSQIISFEVTKS